MNPILRIMEIYIKNFQHVQDELENFQHVQQMSFNHFC